MNIPISLKIPRYASSPSSPLEGQLYFDTTANAFFVYDGTNWHTLPEIYEGASAPSPRGDYQLWIDTSVP